MTAGRILARMTSPQFAALVGAGRKVVALVPIGSTEPHGPHLALATDVVISEAACARAADALDAAGLAVVIAPSVGYGVTDCAEGFAGAVSIDAATLTAFLRGVARGLLAAGCAHVCLVNNHLEPAHDAAVRAAAGDGISVACPLTRQWARTLTPEFKSGACHAGHGARSRLRRRSGRGDGGRRPRDARSARADDRRRGDRRDQKLAVRVSRVAR